MRKTFLIILMLSLVSAAAWGQAQTTGQITGEIVDEDGNAIAGADVMVTNTETGLERSAKTSDNGSFRFGVLPVGNYTVLASATGLQPQVYAFRLGVGETVPVDIALLPGEAITEEIAVYATATNLKTTTTGENFDYRGTVEELPLADRDVEDVAMLSPNISNRGPHTNNERDASGGGYSIAGSMTTEVVVLLDGAEVSDPYFGSAPTLYLEDAIEEVQVLTSGISARYGRFQGGVINAITKSGSNQFEATVRFEAENQDWNSASPFDESQDDNVKETYQATAGGYILKDKFWYFAGARKIPESSESNTTSATQESISTTDVEDRWQVKLRGAPAANHLFDVSHLDFERSRSDRAGLTAGDLDAHTGMRLDDRTSDSLAYQGVLTPTLFLEVQATQKEVAIASGGDAALGDPFFDLNRGEVFNNHWWDFSDPSTRDNETFSANVTQAIDTEKFGSHTLEAGVQLVNSITGGENRQSSTGLNLLSLNPDFFAGQDAGGQTLYNLRDGGALRWSALPLGGNQEIENQAVYVQDTVDIGDWRFDFGLRYDKYDGTGPLPIFDLSFDDISPRLGVTYNLTPDWQILGTWGKYVSRFNDNIGGNVTGVSSAPRIETIYSGPDSLGVTADVVSAALRNDAYWPQITDFVAPDQPTTFLATDIAAPFAEDFQFSIRHALAGNAGSLSFSYINRDFRNILDDFVGGACTDFGLASAAGCSDTTTVIAPDGAEATVDTTVWANTARAVRDYQAFSLQFDLRPGPNWGLGGNYTFSENEGNFEGEQQNQPASGTEIGDFERSRPETSAVPSGTLDEDVTHVANLWGTYRFNFERRGNLALSGLFQWASGSVYSLAAPVSYNDDPLYLTDTNNYTHFFDGRGQNRFDDFWTLDLSVRYELPVYDRLRLWVKLTAQNALNNDSLTSFNTQGSGQLVNGILQFQPAGNCGLGDSPSADCTGFGQIRNEDDYQLPRELFLTVGLRF